MRKFAITVNGQTYEVEVEEIGGAPVYAAAPLQHLLPLRLLLPLHPQPHLPHPLRRLLPLQLQAQTL